MPTTVVHCKREKFDVLIDRTTKWGNPYSGADREAAIRKFAWMMGEAARTYPWVLREIQDELKDRVLGCWCKTSNNPTQPCHGDVLAGMADGLTAAEALARLYPSKQPAP